MDDTPDPPKILGNNVIGQIVQHMLSDDMVIDYDDYQAIRVSFRSLGGSWSSIASGDIKDLELLKKVVMAWGQMPERKKHSERVI